MAANSHPLSIIRLWVGGLTGARRVADLQWGQSRIQSAGGSPELGCSRVTAVHDDKLAVGWGGDGSLVLPQAGLGLFTGQWPGPGQRAMLSRPCEACHFACFYWPNQVPRPAQKLQKYTVPLDGKHCKVMWQRGQLQAGAGESWSPTTHYTCSLLDLMLRKTLDRTQHLPAVIIIVLLLSRVLLFATP